MQAVSVIPHDSIPAWRLELLGGANLFGISVKHNLERKAAAILALLAFEGDITRSRVAGLLWADNDEERARANLRQCLYRLKKLTGVDLVQNSERLALTTALEVDTITLESKAFLGDDAGLIAVRGEILAQLDFEDCPEFEEWLTMQRERWRNTRVGAYRRVLKDLNHHAALEWATGWVQLDPISEEASRTLAQVYQAQNNRSLALQTLQNLEIYLKQELGANLSSQTLALRDSLERDEKIIGFAPVLLPKNTLSPSELVGRETEWLGLEKAWAANSTIVTRGLPGIGKSRLINDFLNTKGKFDLIEARPGDTSVSMSSLARGLRKISNNLELPDWVKLELSRIIPELSNAAAPAINSEADKLRFFEAIFLVLKERFLQGVQILVIDDLQFIDAASLEALQFQLERLQELGMKTVLAYRIGELSVEIETQIETATLNGLMEIIELQPLEQEAFAKLINNLNLEIPPDFAAKLQHSTGGNPLFALETIRYLLEQNALGSNLEKIPLPKMVRQITAKRLEQRSTNAQRIAQVAAIAGTDFTLELAAFALETKIFDLEVSLNELEEAQIMHGEQFAHDLLLESVLEKIGSSVKRFLHRRCAEFLENNGDPARIAEHWLEGGDAPRAVPFLIRAAERVETQGRVIETAIFFEQAALIAMPFDQAEAFKNLLLAFGFALDTPIDTELERLMTLLKKEAITPSQRVEVSLSRAEWCRIQGDPLGAEAAVKQGLLDFTQGGEPSQQASLFKARGGVLQDLGLYEQALSALDMSLSSLPDADAEWHASIQGNKAIILNRLGRPREAFEVHAIYIAGQPDPHSKARGRINQALTLHELGETQKQLELLQRIPQELGNHDNAHLHATLGTSLATTLNALGQYKAAILALFAIPKSNSFKNAEALRVWAAIMLNLGNHTAALDYLQNLEQLNLPPGSMGLAKLIRARITNDQQDWQVTLEMLESAKDSRYLRQFKLAQCPYLTTENALKTAETVLLEAQKLNLPGIELSALHRISQAQLQLGLHKAAHNSSQKAVLLQQTVCSPYISKIEIMFNHAQVLQASLDSKAEIELQKTLQALLEVTQNHVPIEYQQSFLEHNPVNRAILTAAKNAKLEIDF